MNVLEIYASIQGEGPWTGLPYIFLRLAGCNLQCPWCDTKYSLSPVSGTDMSVTEVVDKIKELGFPRVCITGGEPLLQSGEVMDVIKRLPSISFSIETNGSESVDQFMNYWNVIVDMDFKCPSAIQQNWGFDGDYVELARKNLSKLRHIDTVKFVISNREDYEFAKSIATTLSVYRTPIVIFSPVDASPKLAQNIVRWMLEDRLHDVRLGIQVHKVIWGNKRGV